MTLALWLLIYLGITYAVGRLYEVSLGWGKTRMIFYPAMLVAAGGRLLACLLGQQKPGQVDLLRTGGPSAGGSDRLPGGWWFRFLYALLPLAASLAAFVIAWDLLDQPLDIGRTLPRMELDARAVETGAGAAGGQLSGVIASLGEQRLGDWRLWAFLYVGFGLIVAPSPSRDDLISVGIFSVALGALVLALTKAGVEVVASGVYRGVFWEGFSLLLGMALLVLVATFLLLLPVLFLRRSKDD